MSIVGLDRELALSRVGGDLDLLKEIAAIFLEDSPRTIAEIERALSAADCEGLEREAHGLKGAAANFGATGVVDAALKLEQLGRKRDLSVAPAAFASLQEFLAGLHHELRTLCQD